jgi:RNA polymerase subunit RPABC4/transcription elongation factor Spt4
MCVDTPYQILRRPSVKDACSIIIVTQRHIPCPIYHVHSVQEAFAFAWQGLVDAIHPEAYEIGRERHNVNHERWVSIFFAKYD